MTSRDLGSLPPAGFEGETSALIVARMRLVIVLGVFLFVATIPLDALLTPNFRLSLLVRLVGCSLLLALFALSMRRAVKVPFLALALPTQIVLGSMMTGLAFLAPSQFDPYYSAEQSGLLILILATGALLPIGVRELAVLVSVPLLLQTALAAYFGFEGSLPFLPLGQIAALVAVVSGESAFRLRRREYEARMSAKRSEGRFRSIFEQAAVGIALVDRDGRFTRVNQRFCDIHGYPRQALLRLGFQDLSHPDELPANLEDFRRLLTGEIQEFSAERRGVREDGTVMPILLTVAHAHEPESGEDSFIAVVSDITEKHRIEQTRRDLVAMLSHDIKNPLGVVLGLTEILRDEPPDSPAKRQDLLDTIEIAARRALALAVNFVEAKRIESGAFELDRENASLNGIVEHVVAQEQTLARHQKITIELDLSGDVPDLRVDRQAFERVVANLLGNAVKFSPGGGRVRVATVRRGNEVVVSVSDQGPGIPLEIREKLFKRYSHAAGAARKDGSGLGLFIVKTITEAHGGRVSVECPPDGGSVFEVILPVGAAKGLSPHAEAAGG